MISLLNPGLVDEVRGRREFNASACVSCGVCTSTCPMGLAILPRRLFRHVLLGLEHQVLEECEAIYSCLLCRQCEESCPAGVHIAENIRSLRRYTNRAVFGL
jgi:heterodisulfide reductase subunit C